MERKINNYLQVFLLIITVIAVVLISIPIGKFERTNWGVLVSFALNGLIWLALLRWELNKRPFSFQFMHWFFCLMFFSLAALAQYGNNNYPWIKYRSDSILIKANLYLFLWTIGILVGKEIALQKQKNIFKRQTNVGTISKNAILTLTILTIGITTYRVLSVGFVNLFSRATSNITYSNNSVALLVENSMRAIVYFSVCFSIIFAKNNGTKIYFLINVCCLLLAYFPTSTARYAAATIYFGLMLTYSVKLKRSRLFCLLFIVAFIVVLPFMNAFRHNSFGEVDFVAAFISALERTPTVWMAGDYDAYVTFTLAIDFVDAYGPSFGKQLCGALFFWVPRAFWPQKPIGSGATIANSLGWKFTNISCPLPGEAVLNAGIVGIVIFSVFIGYFMQVLDTIYWRKIFSSREGIYPFEMLYPAVVILFFFMCRGDLMSSFSYMMGFVVIWLCSVRFILKKNS